MKKPSSSVGLFKHQVVVLWAYIYLRYSFRGILFPDMFSHPCDISRWNIEVIFRPRCFFFTECVYSIRLYGHTNKGSPASKKRQSLTFLVWNLVLRYCFLFSRFRSRLIDRARWLIFGWLGVWPWFLGPCCFELVGWSNSIAWNWSSCVCLLCLWARLLLVSLFLLGEAFFFFSELLWWWFFRFLRALGTKSFGNFYCAAQQCFTIIVMLPAKRRGPAACLRASYSACMPPTRHILLCDEVVLRWHRACRRRSTAVLTWSISAMPLLRLPIDLLPWACARETAVQCKFSTIFIFDRFLGCLGEREARGCRPRPCRQEGRLQDRG